MIHLLFFMAGLCLAVQAVASLFGIIDHWYAIKKWYPKVILNILLWFGIIIVISLIFGNGYRWAFLFGIFCFCVFHVAGFHIFRFLAAHPVPGKKP